ncbi:MAG TPA: DUF1707 domain-containing protein [Lapillicoccus sp.]|uniref:DUF1707 SHOCT-like domain-containing protein n=1 Tax=Lapillicoccus sp. TaxID=1909287 RepID=UPI002F937C29
MTDAGSLRVGHDEREQLVHVLMQQYAEGRLTAPELDDLSGRARQARTYADLDRLVADLPVPPPSAGVRQTAATANLARLGQDPDHRQSITGGMSSYVRRGVWTVPAYLSLNAGMATVKLDFQQAICPHGVVDIAVSAGVGSVVLVVPEGWAANTDQVGKGIGAVSNTVDAIPQPGKPLLILHGTSMAGTVRVRYPTRRDRYLMRRNVKRLKAGSSSSSGVETGPGSAFGGSATGTGTPQDAPQWGVTDRRY